MDAQRFRIGGGKHLKKLHLGLIERLFRFVMDFWGYQEVLNGGRPPAKTPPLWDGHAAERIVNVIKSL